MVEKSVEGIKVWLSSDVFYMGDAVTGAVCIE
jgi:hypothetical protein